MATLVAQAPMKKITVAAAAANVASKPKLSATTPVKQVQAPAATGTARAKTVSVPKTPVTKTAEKPPIMPLEKGNWPVKTGIKFFYPRDTNTFRDLGLGPDAHPLEIEARLTAEEKKALSSRSWSSWNENRTLQRTAIASTRARGLWNFTKMGLDGADTGVGGTRDANGDLLSAGILMKGTDKRSLHGHLYWIDRSEPGKRMYSLTPYIVKDGYFWQVGPKIIRQNESDADGLLEGALFVVAVAAIAVAAQAALTQAAAGASGGGAAGTAGASAAPASTLAPSTSLATTPSAAVGGSGLKLGTGTVGLTVKAAPAVGASGAGLSLTTAQVAGFAPNIGASILGSPLGAGIAEQVVKSGASKVIEAAKPVTKAAEVVGTVKEVAGTAVNVVKTGAAVVGTVTSTVAAVKTVTAKPPATKPPTATLPTVTVTGNKPTPSGEKSPLWLLALAAAGTYFAA